MHWSFGKHWFPELWGGLSNVETFYYTIFKKTTFVNISTELIRKAFKRRKDVKLMAMDTGFLKFPFLLEKLKLYHYQQGLSFSLK